MTFAGIVFLLTKPTPILVDRISRKAAPRGANVASKRAPDGAIPWGHFSVSIMGRAPWNPHMLEKTTMAMNENRDRY
jgi:hypothetical protein